jgi:ABC-type polysaccharide/polyol phosphate transport system ATPase subunit
MARQNSRPDTLAAALHSKSVLGLTPPPRDPVIEFRNVSKTYSRKLGRAFLGSHVASWVRRARPELFYALRDVSFTVMPGESLAVVGANGAGKSTLLSLVAGISFPDRGSVSVKGAVAALLELGSGFHPDLTGAENVLLNASLLGLSRKQVMERFDAIVEFSGIGNFIHEALRTYSTGMVVRLAFAVAVNVDPDILIIDEVLAVGDQNFQAKCIDRIEQFKRAGKTLICVSHAASILEQLCGRALWLNQGELVLSGGASEVIRAYSGGLAPRPA